MCQLTNFSRTRAEAHLTKLDILYQLFTDIQLQANKEQLITNTICFYSCAAIVFIRCPHSILIG